MTISALPYGICDILLDTTALQLCQYIDMLEISSFTGDEMQALSKPTGHDQNLPLLTSPESILILIQDSAVTHQHHQGPGGNGAH